MPATDQKPQDAPTIPPDLLREIRMLGSQHDLAHQIACLRQELAEVKALLTQPASVIITGKEAERIYAAIAAATKEQAK